MEDSLHFDIHAQARVRPVRRARGVPRLARPQGMATGGHAGDQPELLLVEPINVYHWAAVALVTSLMCAVLAFAAGTPALSRASSVTSVVFGVVGGSLVLAGVIRALRFRLSRVSTGGCAS
jgi:hypothetical protein